MPGAAFTFLVGSSKYLCSAGGKACNNLILSVWETDYVQRFRKQPRQVTHDKICTEKIIIKITEN